MSTGERRPRWCCQPHAGQVPPYPELDRWVLPVQRPPRPATGRTGQAALHQWEIAIHTDDDLPLLVKIGELHAHSETIDPFGDGNGRVGRLLITFLLTEWGALRHPLRQRDPQPEQVAQGARWTRDARVLW